MKKFLLIWVILGLSVLLAIDVLRFIYTRQDFLGLTHIATETDLTTLQGKIELFIRFFFYNGLFVYGMILVIISLRLGKNKVDPVHDEPPAIIQCGNQILRNTLQQSVIFFGLYSHFLFSQSNNKNVRLAVAFPVAYLVGRVLFAIGYLFGTSIKVPQLRGLGFVLTLLNLVCLLCQTTHLMPMPKFLQ